MSVGLGVVGTLLIVGLMGGGIFVLMSGPPAPPPPAKPLPEPPVVTQPKAETAVPARFVALAENLEVAMGTLHAPDPSRMHVSIADLEQRWGGTVVFSQTEWQDMWLLARADGSWVSVQLEDGLHAEFPTPHHMAVALLVEAGEEAESEEELEMRLPFARALGIPRPEEALALIDQPSGDVDYEEWRAGVQNTIAAWAE